MPHSLKSRIKSLCYKGEITEKERDKIIKALEQQPCVNHLDNIRDHNSVDNLEWYTPEERLPKEDDGVIATISGSANGILFDHAMVLLYWDNKEGWQSSDYEFSELIVHAWCDLEAYGG